MSNMKAIGFRYLDFYGNSVFRNVGQYYAQIGIRECGRNTEGKYGDGRCKTFTRFGFLTARRILIIITVI